MSAFSQKRTFAGCPTAWILRSLVASLLGEGERAWSADFQQFLRPMSSATPS